MRSIRQSSTAINAGSMADIAFLLLIFFLVTTTMDVDQGIKRILPSPSQDEVPIEVPKRNVLNVLVNDAGSIMVRDRPMELEGLRDAVRDFMLNASGQDDLPQRRKITEAFVRSRIQKSSAATAVASDEQHRATRQAELDQWRDRLLTVELIGEYMELPGNAVIALQTGSRTSYDVYVQVQNELEAAIRELRDELSQEKFGRKFTALNERDADDRELIKAIRMVHPQRISEIEPMDLETSN